MLVYVKTLLVSIETLLLITAIIMNCANKRRLLNLLFLVRNFKTITNSTGAKISPREAYKISALNLI